MLGGYHYCYKIFEVELTSEVFTSPKFKAERASIRIMGTEEKLKALFSHSSMEVCTCIYSICMCLFFPTDKHT